jgi:ribosomal protein S18 acetylase RimI-like enzyme
LPEFALRPLEEGDRGLVRELLLSRWGSTRFVSKGQMHDAESLPGFLALDAEEPVGLVTYRLENGDCELFTLDSLAEGRGVGSALVDAVRAEARDRGCKRVWLITTNDNTPALRFYQRRGFTLAAVRLGALAESRLLKPEIPATGLDGIPLRDELELEIQP